MKRSLEEDFESLRQLFDLRQRSQFEQQLSLSKALLLKRPEYSFLERLRKKVRPADTPLTAFYGAALWELGQKEEGRLWLETYLQKYAHNHDERYREIALCCLGGSSKAGPSLVAWPRPLKAESDSQECFRYLIPFREDQAIDLEPVLSEVPQDWESFRPNIRMEDSGFQRPELGLTEMSQVVSVELHCRAQQSFAPLQTCLAYCRNFLYQGGIGVWDEEAERWYSAAFFESRKQDVFEVADHISLVVQEGTVRTQGLRSKFSAKEVEIGFGSPYLLEAANYLLCEIAEALALGKEYSEKSLFRWRAQAQLCQLMFRPHPEKPHVLQAVDMHLDNGVVRPSVSALAAVRYFCQAAPHWDLKFGWPPLAPPEFPRGGEGCLFGLLPGVSRKEDALEALGAPSKEVGPFLLRWVFENEAGEQPLRVEVEVDEGGLLSAVCTNRDTDTGLDSLGEATLVREFRAPPDMSLVRVEKVWLRSSKEESGTLLVAAEFDPGEALCQVRTTHFGQAKEVLRKELEPAFGKTIPTGFTSRPISFVQADDEGRRLRTYMESSIRFVREAVSMFGKIEWLREDLNGYSIVVGTYLLCQGIPSRQSLEKLGLPAAPFLEAFLFLHDYLEHPTTKVGVYEETGVQGRELAAFQWLITNLTQGTATSQELSLARDMAQLFQAFRAMLKPIIN